MPGSNMRRCHDVGTLSSELGRCHLLHMMGVEVHDMAVLVAQEVEAAGGTAAHNAGALRPPQHRFELWHVARIDLQPQGLGPTCVLPTDQALLL